MNRQAEGALDFHAIRERLARLTQTEGGRRRALELEPSSDAGDVARMLAETSEARRLEDEGRLVALGDLPDIEPALERLRIEGLALDVADFASLARFAAITGTLVNALTAEGDDLPQLSGRAQRMPRLEPLEARIHRVIDTEKEEVRDGASPELQKLRAQAARLKKKLEKLLDKTLLSRANAKILQEPIVTTRNGRPVVPVKAECKSQFPGIVHGASASGATLFVEPLDTVEVGNEMASVHDRERQELRRILTGLTEVARPFAPALSEALTIVTEIDVIQAKGRLSASYAGAPPKVSSGELRLVDARHPLLPDPVPIGFHLAGGRRGLVFTGPNTGGKTIALKTAGLLSLMTQTGLHVPASPESVFPVFRSIFADIGDDQSIASSLSTFSAHLAKVVEMDRELTLPALVILDEVGTGTDPAEGGALGCALVEHFLGRGALVIVSTHHGLLKAYASTTPGIGAASFQFDSETYEPTFEIVDGATGKSLAFEMAARLGVPAEVVARARELQDESERQVKELACRLEAKEAALEKERRQARDERRAAEKARARIEAEEERERRARAESLKSFREALAGELENTRREIRELVSEAKRARTEHSVRLAELEKKLAKKLDALTSPLLRKARAETEALLETRLELEPGARVLVASFGMEGEVVKLLGAGQAEVLVHDKKLRLPVSGLEPLPAHPAKKTNMSPAVDPAHALEPKDMPSELNLIGCTVEEALERADKFLDDAVLSEHREVRLIHGHGTGRLKSALREWLTSHPLVLNQKSENRGGVTVVELRD